jgi:radical SAM protein with 4Fe4S-binding SPASM domain
MVLSKLRREARRFRQGAGALPKWLSYRSGRTRLHTYPDRMYLESTNVCNLKCVMCPTGLGMVKRPKGYMDYGLFAQVIDEMAPHVKTTTLHIWGEPLLHPRIYDMIAYCRAKGLHSEISTNATLLSEENGRRIIDAGLEAIYLCLDGATRETYEKVRCSADYEQTRSNIKRFLEMKARRGADLRVSVQIIDIKPTSSEVQRFKQMWSLPGVDRVHVKAFDSWAGQVDEINELRTDQETQHTPDVRRYHCPNLWYHVHIYWDGTLVCCDRDFNAAYPLGNVRNGVMQAWNGPRMIELRRKHLKGQLEDVSSCGQCTEWRWWRPTPFSSHGNAPQQ